MYKPYPTQLHTLKMIGMAVPAGSLLLKVNFSGTVLELKNEHFSISSPDTSMDNEIGNR